MKMQRVINRLSLLFVSAGAMLGSGLLFAPLFAAKTAGPAAILSWGLGGLLIMIVALTFCELSAMLPLAGGIARFPQFSHGGLVSFVMTWLAWIAYALIPPLEVQASLQYAAVHFPWLKHGVGLSPLGYLTAAILLFIMSVLNIFGLRIVAKFNNLLVIFKILVPAITVVGFFIVAFHHSNFTAHGGFMPNGIKPVLTALPLAGVAFSFFGFRLAVELGGEVKNPQKALPLALIGSIIICMIIYMLMQSAFIAAIPAHALTHGWKHLNFAGESGPFVGISKGLELIWLVILLYVIVIISPFSSALMVVTTTSRLNYAVAKNGFAPKGMLDLNKKGVPYKAIIVNFIVGMALLAPLPGWQEIVGVILGALVLSHSIIPITLVALRKQVPEMYRPFRLPAATVVSLVAFCVLNLVAYWAGWQTMSKMYIAIVIGLVLLFAARLFQKDKPPLCAKQALWFIPYFIGMALFSYFGNFSGGHHDIPFGLDMVYVVLFSIIIFFWGVSQRLTPEEAQQAIDKEKHLFPSSYR